LLKFYQNTSKKYFGQFQNAFTKYFATAHVASLTFFLRQTLLHFVINHYRNVSLLSKHTLFVDLSLDNYIIN